MRAAATSTTGVQSAGTAVGDTSHCRQARHAFSAAPRPLHLRVCGRRDRCQGTTEEYRRAHTADRRPACPPDGAAVTRRPPSPVSFRHAHGGDHTTGERCHRQAVVAAAVLATAAPQVVGGLVCGMVGWHLPPPTSGGGHRRWGERSREQFLCPEGLVQRVLRARLGL